MDIQYCHYHLDAPATWRCSHCPRHYCNHCVPVDAEEFRVRPVRCTVCNNALLYLGAANTAQPFWERIGTFFAYPLHQHALIILGIFSILSAIFNGFLLSLLLICIFTKYLYYVLEQSSEGHSEPPPPQSAFLPEHLGLFFKQFGVLFTLLAVVGLIARITESPFLTIVVGLFVILMLPASIMVLALEKEVGPAVNPQILWRVVQCIGWRYLIVFAYAFICSSSDLI